MKSIVLAGVDKVVKYMDNVPRALQTELEIRSKSLKSATRKEYRRNLYWGHGKREGVYKANIIARDLDRTRENISFVVGGRKPHYRLAHLIENGHRIISHGKDTGKKTRSFPHVQPAQEFANKEIIKLYDEAIERALKKS